MDLSKVANLAVDLAELKVLARVDKRVVLLVDPREMLMVACLAEKKAEKKVNLMAAKLANHSVELKAELKEDLMAATMVELKVVP